MITLTAPAPKNSRRTRPVSRKVRTSRSARQDSRDTEFLRQWMAYHSRRYSDLLATIAAAPRPIAGSH